MQTLAPSQEDTTKETEKKCSTDKCDVTGIYGLRNKINGKWYVGQSIVSIQGRWNIAYKRLHCKKQKKLYNALLKYGYDNFDKVVLEICNPVQEELDIKENQWITIKDSINNGYNIKEGGSHGKMSEESKLKMSISATGRLMSESAKQKMRKPKTEEHRQKIAQANKDRSIMFTGKKLSDSHKQKLKDAWKKRKESTATIQ